MMQPGTSFSLNISSWQIADPKYEEADATPGLAVQKGTQDFRPFRPLRREFTRNQMSKPVPKSSTSLKKSLNSGHYGQCILWSYPW
jgi:hypothetical protein